MQQTSSALLDGRKRLSIELPFWAHYRYLSTALVSALCWQSLSAERRELR
jgi:hypothetical protein